MSESESESGSHSSPSTEPEVIPISQSKPKGSSTKQSPHKNGKNEGTDPDWAYKPPPGAVLVDHEVDFGEFEWGDIEGDEDSELWLIRVPDGVGSCRVVS